MEDVSLRSLIAPADVDRTSSLTGALKLAEIV